ncbi:hypothetical protein F5Y19DRAFT_477082 [Xylariaceae sp. FL1651]|nr:hypothetical protein F5Y19DRAFT_477082 [Xylariaceae sp. FL1651]
MDDSTIRTTGSFDNRKLVELLNIHLDLGTEVYDLIFNIALKAFDAVIWWKQIVFDQFIQDDTMYTGIIRVPDLSVSDAKRLGVLPVTGIAYYVAIKQAAARTSGLVLFSAPSRAEVEPQDVWDSLIENIGQELCGLPKNSVTTADRYLEAIERFCRRQRNLPRPKQYLFIIEGIDRAYDGESWDLDTHKTDRQEKVKRLVRALGRFSKYAHVNVVFFISKDFDLEGLVEGKGHIRGVVEFQFCSPQQTG